MSRFSRNSSRACDKHAPATFEKDELNDLTPGCGSKKL